MYLGKCQLALYQEGCFFNDDCLSSVLVQLWFAHGSCPRFHCSVTTACQQMGQLFWLPQDFCNNYFARFSSGFYDAYLAQFSDEGLRRAAVPQVAELGCDSSVVSSIVPQCNDCIHGKCIRSALGRYRLVLLPGCVPLVTACLWFWCKAHGLHTWLHQGCHAIARDVR